MPERKHNRPLARIAGLLIIPLALATLGSKFHNKPDPKLGGGLTGKVSPIAELEDVIVVEPTEFKVYLAKIDRKAGSFTIKGLPPGKYDLMLKFNAVLVEGVRLNVQDGFEELSEEDRKAIEHVTWITDDYFNSKTIIRVGGNAKRIKLIADQVRDLHTVDPSGAALAGLLVRRLELTDMRKTGQIWTIKKVRHLFREERKKSLPGFRLKYLYAPKLGGIRVGDEVVEVDAIDFKKLKHEPVKHFYSARHREGQPTP